MRSANCLAESTPSGSTMAFFAWTHFGSMGLRKAALCGEQERQDPYPLARLFDLLIVLANPLPHQLADMPRRIVPDQQPLPFSLGGLALTTLFQELDRECADRSSSDKAQPDLRT